MFFFSRALLATSFLALAACGGGGSSSSSSGSSSSGGGGANPPPRLSFFSHGGYIGSGESATLNWASDGTSCTAGGGWSGAKSASGSQTVGPLTQTTTFTLSCTNMSSTASNATVTIVTGSPLPPAPTASKVISEENLTSLDFSRLPYGVQAMAWSPVTQRLYAVTTQDSPTAPNSLLSINPVTLTVQVLSMEGPMLSIAVTDNGQYVYVGHRAFVGDTVNGVRRVRTSDLTVDLSFPVGTTNSSVLRMAPAPGSAHTVAVIANRLTSEYEEYGLIIYDDAVPRPKFAAPSTMNAPNPPEVPINVIDADWSADGSMIYTSGSYSAGLHYLDVDAQGVTFNRHRNWPTASPGTVVDDRYFSTDGRVFNLDGPVNLASRIPDYYFPSPARLPVPSRGKVFSVGTNLDGLFEDGTRIMSFDIDTYAYIDAVVFNGLAHFRPGQVESWGTDGLAISAENQLIIAHGTFAAAGGVPPEFPDTLPVLASGVGRNPAGDLVNFRVANVRAWATASNSCGKLYVSTARDSWVRPGAVLEVNPDTLTITRSASGGADPFILSASEDCSTLYVGQQYSSSALRLRASDLATTDVLPVGGEYFSRVRSMSVAPGQPQTVALSLGDVERTLCAGSDDGVLIYDGNVARPLYKPDDNLFSIKSVAFGANPAILYAEDVFNVYAFDANENGLSNRRTVMPNPRTTWDYDLGRDLHFDPVANRVYNKLGNVFDATVNAELPRISLAHPPFSDGCGTPLQGAVTDPTTGKLYWIGESRQYYLGISAYARNGLTRLGAVDIGLGDQFGELGAPRDLVRLAGNRLAFVTRRGYLVVLEGGLLAP